MADRSNSKSNTLITGTSGADYVSNYGNNVTINVGTGSDTVYNTTSNVTIDGGKGNDSIENYSPEVSINGGDGKDTIGNYGSDSTIDGGAGNDYIENRNRDRVSINGGAGNDTIDGGISDSLTIVGGTGNDSISLDYFCSDNVIKYASGDGNDTVSGFNETSMLIIGGDTSTYSTQVSGDDIIVTVDKGAILLREAAHLPYININGTLVNAGKTINNTASNKTINGTDANDSIENSGNKVKINGLAGNDTIYSTGNKVTIDGGNDNDRLENSGANVSINGGEGNDDIGNIGENVTITSGEGHDSVYTYADNVTIDSGEGNDSITNAYNKNISIFGGAGADSIYNVASSYVTINGGAGDDTIANGGTNISVNGGNGNDSISGYNDYSTILGGKGNDKIYGNHFKTKIDGGAGNDLISIGDHWGNTISGGNGNDSITVTGGSEHSINGGAGNDIISLGSAYGTIRGGAGDDKIYGSTAASHLYQYFTVNGGDGNETIYGWSSNDTLTIPGGSFSYKVSGKNGIVTIADSGKITLVGAKGKTVNINGKNYANATNVFTPQDVIKSFMGSLDTTEESGVYALNEAVSVASGGYFKNIQSAIDQMVADCRNAKSSDDFLQTYCGIDLDSDDTGAITGSDAGGSVTKNASDIVPESGTVNDFTGDTFTTNGLTVKLGSIPYDGKYVYRPSGLNFSNISSDAGKKYIWQASETWWVKNSLDLIAESYGNNYGFGTNSSATTNTLYFGFFNEDGGSLAWTAKPGNVLAMAVNMSYYGNIDSNDPDGYGNSSSGYLDRTIAHEMTHVVMKATVNYFNDLPQFIKEGMAELTHGIDDQRTTRISTLAGNATRLNNALTLLDTGTGNSDAYAGGYMFLRYFAKQASENYTYVNPLNTAVADKSVAQTSISAADTTTVRSALLTLDKNFPDERLYLSDYDSSVKKVNAKALTKPIMIVGNTNANSIVTGSGNDTVFANNGKDTLRGGSGNDILCGEAGNDKLYGDAGADTLSGGTGNDTLTGGKGNDVFVHVADTDFITDYTAGQDKIKLTEGKVFGLAINNSNLVMDIGMYGSITVKNGVNKKITVIDANDNETLISGTAYDNSSPAKVTLASGVLIGDASSRTAAIKITGNALDNTILGGSKADTIYGKNGDDYLVGNSGNDKLYGQNGNDTLWGGMGNDTLTGGKGADVFIYNNGEGKDVINDFDDSDMLQIIGTFSATYNSSAKTIAFKVGTTANAITLKNFTATTFNINGDAYQISGKELVKK